jgi:hypothetical protein
MDVPVHANDCTKSTAKGKPRLAEIPWHSEDVIPWLCSRCLFVRDSLSCKDPSRSVDRCFEPSAFRRPTASSISLIFVCFGFVQCCSSQAATRCILVDRITLQTAAPNYANAIIKPAQPRRCSGTNRNHLPHTLSRSFILQPTEIRPEPPIHTVPKTPVPPVRRIPTTILLEQRSLTNDIATAVFRLRRRCRNPRCAAPGNSSAWIWGRGDKLRHDGNTSQDAFEECGLRR